MFTIIDIFNNIVIKKKIFEYLDNIELRRVSKYFKKIYDEDYPYLNIYFPISYNKQQFKEIIKVSKYLESLVTNLKKIKILTINIAYDIDEFGFDDTLTILLISIIFHCLNNNFLNKLSIKCKNTGHLYITPPIDISCCCYHTFNSKISKIKELIIDNNVSLYSFNFNNLKNLIKLNISSNSYTNLFNFKKNEFWDNIIENLPNLEYLIFNGNEISNMYPKVLNFKNFKNSKLYHIEEKIIFSLKNRKNLKILYYNR